ncbi:ubiquitin-related domain-containing protein [Pilaira anomala]|nr:ubiquitin-related domain-containing protein [Pilaira anomala]
MSDHSELISQFISATDAPESQAQFYLEMSQWNLELAVSQYYDNAGGAATEAAPATEESNTPVAPVSASSSSGPATPTKRKAATSSKIRTLNDIGKGSDSDEEHENLYAGGEKSGMVVQGPNKKGGNNSLVDEILKKAAEGGPAPEEEQTVKSEKKPAYTGSGYRLGSEDEPSSLAQPSSPIAPAIVEDTEPVTRHLTFWRNGFSVDDGPLYLYTDPANQEMLTAINSGRAPLSLLNVRHGQPVEVRVVKRQEEDYTPPPKAPPKPFEGTGNRLGSPATYVAPTPAPGAFPSSSSSSTAAPTVDESQPTTNIQIRLGDGTRLIAKLNHTHTIGDLRQYIESSAQANGRPFILQTTFPVKELKDNNQTLKEAGLLNSVVVQRYQ